MSPECPEFPIIILRFAKQNTTTAATATQATLPMSKANGNRYTTDYMARKKRKSSGSVLSSRVRMHRVIKGLDGPYDQTQRRGGGTEDDDGSGHVAPR